MGESSQRRLPAISTRIQVPAGDGLPLIGLYSIQGQIQAGDECQVDEPVVVTVTNGDGEVIGRADAVVTTIAIKSRATHRERRHTIRIGGA